MSDEPLSEIVRMCQVSLVRSRARRQGDKPSPVTAARKAVRAFWVTFVLTIAIMTTFLLVR